MPADRYTVRVSKDSLVFSAGHFITFGGGECERLHGHNWRVSVEVDGALDENHYVFDFIALRDRTREITDELEHRMLLPTASRFINVTADAKAVHVRCGDLEWKFPRVDCVLLPVANTTAELIARWIGQRLLDALKSKHNYTPDALRIEVEENFGQVATWRWQRESK
jgi:6-pyruvoyltetrahydropterin/6-carboxytetrahydropterin synthase